MRMKNLLVIILILTTAISRAQLPEVKKVDYEKIKQEINDKKSPYYYPTLMERYRALDETLTHEDFRHLYYGSIFQDTYNPYGSSSWKDSTRTLARKQAPSEAELQQLITFSENGLKEYPFEFDFLFYLAYAHGKLGHTREEGQYRKLILGLGGAILSSGRGKTDKDGIHVTCVSDEYTVISLLGYEFGGEQSLHHVKKESFDYLTLAPNDDKIKGLYFNITRVFENLSKQFGK